MSDSRVLNMRIRILLGTMTLFEFIDKLEKEYKEQQRQSKEGKNVVSKAVRKFGSQAATSEEEVQPVSIATGSKSDSSSLSALMMLRTYSGKSVPERIVEFSSLDDFRCKMVPVQEKEEQRTDQEQRTRHEDQGVDQEQQSQMEISSPIMHNEDESKPGLPCESPTNQNSELNSEEKDSEERPKTLTCPNCGKPILQRKSGRGQRKIFCSRECKDQYSYKNPDSERTIIVPCEFCGKQFAYYRRNNMAKAYCSVSCARQSILGGRKDGDK